MMNSGKRQMTEGIELPNKKSHNSRRKRNFQILGNIRSGYHQISEGERKDKKRKPYRRRIKKTTRNQTT